MRSLGGIGALVGADAAAIIGLGWRRAGSAFPRAGGSLLLRGRGGRGLGPHIFLTCAIAHHV